MTHYERTHKAMRLEKPDRVRIVNEGREVSLVLYGKEVTVPGGAAVEYPTR